MAGYSCKQLSNNDAIKIEGLFNHNPIVFHKNNFFMEAPAFVEFFENANVAEQSLDHLLGKLVYENTKNVQDEDKNQILRGMLKIVLGRTPQFLLSP